MRTLLVFSIALFAGFLVYSIPTAIQIEMLRWQMNPWILRILCADIPGCILLLLLGLRWFAPVLFCLTAAIEGAALTLGSVPETPLAAILNLIPAFVSAGGRDPHRVALHGCGRGKSLVFRGEIAQAGANRHHRDQRGGNGAGDPEQRQRRHHVEREKQPFGKAERGAQGEGHGAAAEQEESRAAGEVGGDHAGQPGIQILPNERSRREFRQQIDEDPHQADSDQTQNSPHSY